MQPYVPPTKEVWLPSEGRKDGRSTLHVYDGQEIVDPSTLRHADEKTTRGDRPAVGLMYRCTETGTRRRWGIV